MFKPLWRNPDHPAIAAAAAALFEDPKSPWNPSVWRGDATVAEGHQRDLFATPLLGLKAFRTLVIRALGDKTEVGTIETDANGRVIVIQGHHRTVSDGEAPSTGSTTTPTVPGTPSSPARRRCRCAWPTRPARQLEQLEGIPRFQKQWPLAKRDEAIAATVAYLTRYGERFRENAASRAIRAEEPGDPNHEKAILAFDPLDHPATAADVAEGRAIFSLDGAGAEVRRVALPTFPIAARWTKLEVFPDDPPIMRISDGEGHDRPDIEGMQTGRVWQAEEVREGDRWRRYYGFVGRHALTRVPAEEIEFPASWQRRLVAALDRPGRRGSSSRTPRRPARSRSRSRSGTTAGSRRPPRPTSSATPAARPRSARGSPSGSSASPTRPSRPTRSPGLQGGAPEKPFPPRRSPPGRSAGTQRGRRPRRSRRPSDALAFRLDLRTVFPIDRPGRYRLEITFDDLKAADGSQSKVATEFGVVSRTKE